MSFAVLTTLLLTQAPDCISVLGARVCGYSCKTANGVDGRCAATPSGVCQLHAGKVVCFDPPVWLAVALGGAPPEPKCLTDGSAIACGYNCVNQLGKVACASTPAGACKARPDNQIVCADPPPEVYGVFGSKAPPMSCRIRLQEVACGYNCTDSGGQLACTKTPMGTCDTQLGPPTCVDPDKFVICAGGAQTKPPKCQLQGTTLACGYNCTTAGSAVACAKTPQGSCDTGGPGGPTCFDPPLRAGSSKCLRVIGAE